MEIREYTGNEMAYAKGASLWGSALPYLKSDGAGKRWVVYGDWWTEERLMRFSDWEGDALRQLRWILGTDRDQRIRAEGRVLRERAEARGDRAVLRDMFSTPTWTAQEAARIDDLVRGWVEVRERVRSWLSEARNRYREVAADLTGDPASWSTLEMANAAIRQPWILRHLIRLDELTEPQGLVPERAYA